MASNSLTPVSVRPFYVFFPGFSLGCFKFVQKQVPELEPGLRPNLLTNLGASSVLHLGLGPLGVQIAILLSWRRSLFCCAVAGCFCGHLHDSLVALGAGTFIFLWGQVPELESSLVDLVTDYGASSALHLRLGRRWA